MFSLHYRASWGQRVRGLHAVKSEVKAITVDLKIGRPVGRPV